MKQRDQLTISGNKKKSQRKGGITMARLRAIFVVGAAILVQLMGVLTFAATLFAQELFWARSPGTGNAQGLGIAVDSSGNSYVTGTYSGTLTFAGITLPFAAAGANDIFLAKYDSNGTAVWATSDGTTGSDSGNAIAIDGSGNSYVTGQLDGRHVFVAKYLDTGIQDWRRIASGTGGDCTNISQPSCSIGHGIGVDGSGNIYVTGLYRGTVTFAPGLPEEFQLSSTNGSNDTFLASYDNNGNFLWAKSAGGTGSDQGFAIAVDASGNSYVTGVITNNGNDVFLTKYDKAGTVQWGPTIVGDAGNNQGFGIAVDGKENSYVTGVDSGNIFVAKFGSNGTRVWTTNAAGAGTGGFGIALDGSGYIYVAGNRSPGDIFVAKFVEVVINNVPNGTLAWLKNAGSSAAANETGFGIGVDSSGNSYVTGRFQGTAGPPLIQRSLVQESRMKPNSPIQPNPSRLATMFL